MKTVEGHTSEGPNSLVLRQVKAPRYFKAKVLEDHQADGTNDTLKKAIAGEQTIVFTDKSPSYVDIADYVELHINEKSNE